MLVGIVVESAPRRRFSYAEWVQHLCATLETPLQLPTQRASVGELFLQLAFRDSASGACRAGVAARDQLRVAVVAILPSEIREAALLVTDAVLENILELALEGRYEVDSSRLCMDLARGSYPCIQKLSRTLYFVN